MARPVYDVFEHFLPSTHKSSLRGEAEAIHNCNKSDSKHGDNLSLLTSRQTQVIGDDEFNTTFVSDKIVDLNFYRRGGEAVSPLYLKNTKTAQKNLKKQTNLFEEDDIFQGKDKIENFTPEFREFIDSKYGEHFSPEAILGYIYAVLFHKDYREKYLDFLKIDFPKIPFVESKEKFLALSELGQELIDLHLMRAFIGGGGNRSGLLQYWAKCSQTIETSGELAICDGDKSASGFINDGRGQHRGRTHIPPISLQHAEGEEVFMQIALICDRGCKLQQIDNFFVSSNIIDLHLVGSGSYAFPLYLYNRG